ncbi:ABC transporter ATP-binding protein [Brucella intermedia]|uniref:ABC transporter ATP-binding protein n=1 Tax=Brucella intermedia TaxID=94625 RepID=UPI00224B64DC|nr:oligopeptide/dipeptide ABC transporter ATP-binding protein [Brucella intermedia]
MSKLPNETRHASSINAPKHSPIIEVKGVSKRFGKKDDLFTRAMISLGLDRPSQTVRALDSVNLKIKKGEVVGLVGESGCGKSTLGRIVAGILPPSDGEVHWHGKDIQSLSAKERHTSRLKTQMVFQNPFASINPRMPIAEVVGEAARIHGLIAGNKKARSQYVDEQLERAGLDPSLKGRYVHQFSGGQRQRIGIARALAVQPDILVCDEAVAALDVSIQAQILNLFMDLREELGLTYLFISHDLGVVEHISDRVAIMYLGRIIEEAPATEIFSRPNHPYTQALLQEVPRIETKKRDFSALKGELPSPLNPPSGCHFHPRCPFSFERCRTEQPSHKVIALNHKAACHLNDI